MTVQNDADFPERLNLRGSRLLGGVIGIGFISHFYNPAGDDITDPVFAGSFLTSRLAPGQIYRVRMVITIPRGSPLRWRSMPLALVAFSTTHTWARDGARSVTSRA